jgi:hypothetical protein
MATQGISALKWSAPPHGIKISDMSGKNPYAPMVGKGSIVKVEGRQTSGVLKQSLAQSAQDGMPKAHRLAII